MREVAQHVLIYVINYPVLLTFYRRTSAHQLPDNLLIPISKSNHRDFHFTLIALSSFITQSRKLRQPRLHLILDVKAELAYLGQRIGRIIEFILELGVHFWVNFKFYGIVGSRDCRYVPRDVVVFFDTFYVFNKYLDK